MALIKGNNHFDQIGSNYSSCQGKNSQLVFSKQKHNRLARVLGTRKLSQFSDPCLLSYYWAAGKTISESGPECPMLLLEPVHILEVTIPSLSLNFIYQFTLSCRVK